MGCLTPPETLQAVSAKGIQKANMSLRRILLLSFLGGIYIASGYLACLRVSAGFPPEWSGVGSFVGACVFPIGLMAIIFAGGELVTGNMLVVTVPLAQRKIGVTQLVYNWAVVTLGNLAGAITTAFLFGHVAGLTEGRMTELTIAAALSKTNAGFVVAFVSAIGCNIFVGLAVWMSFSAQNFSGKLMGIWFPVMIFVAIGFQHVVANMFIIPAAIFAGAEELSWMLFAQNFVPVFLGNAVGGAFLGVCYQWVYDN